MKKPLLFPCILCLLTGLILGVLIPVRSPEYMLTPAHSEPAPLSPADPRGNTSNGAAAASPSQKTQVDPQDNFPLLNTACAVNRLLNQQDYAALASYVHPTLGVTFTPYSTVNPESDLVFTAEQIKNLSKNDSVYTWGFEAARGNPLKMTMTEYFERYVYNVDYTQAPEIGIDQVVVGGNALENLTEVYPDCRFVDFCFPAVDPVNGGLDWSSLKLVFRFENTRWYLVGMVHGEWTI